MKTKVLLGLGFFTTALGIASVTEEVHGCLMCPLDGFFWYWGMTSEEVFGFLPHIWWQITVVGVAITLVAWAMLRLDGQPVSNMKRKPAFKFPKLKPWGKRRMLAHGVVYALILVHITLTVLGLTELKSVCPRSLGELVMHGQFGTSAAFWTIILLLVFLWGRGLCGWLCVFAPIQEQSVNLLKAFGFDPTKKAFKPNPIIWITTTMVWSAMAFYFVKNWNNWSFDIHHGQSVASYWVFVGGVLTTMPLSMLITYFLGPRWFCKYLCPVGGFQSLFSRLSLGKIQIEISKCLDCGACTKNCQMGVNIDKYIAESAPAISDMNCIFCGDCVDKCPKAALRFGIGSVSEREPDDALAPAKTA